jgi:hypothetical protein
MANTKVMFFMITTDRGIVIADYAVRSFEKISGVSFVLRIFPNWVRADLKRRYIDKWRRLPWVEIIDNDWQTEANRPADRRLDGPFEHYDAIWDRELKLLDTPYHATVDSDFEILDGSFVKVILNYLDAHPNVALMSTDYSPTRECFESFSQKQVLLHECWHTWFCIYRRVALECDVSHSAFVKTQEDSEIPAVWDSASRFQQALKEVHGFDLAALDFSYQQCFIHYGAFSKNRHINRRNVAAYRRLQIAKMVGFFGSGDLIGRRLATVLDRAIFRSVDRSRHLTGWGQW